MLGVNCVSEDPSFNFNCLLEMLISRQWVVRKSSPRMEILAEARLNVWLNEYEPISTLHFNEPCVGIEYPPIAFIFDDG